MKHFIISSLEFMCKAGFIAMVLFGVSLGAAKGSFSLAIAGGVTAMALGILLFGGLFVLLEINENLGALRKIMEKQNEPDKKE